MARKIGRWLAWMLSEFWSDYWPVGARPVTAAVQ